MLIYACYRKEYMAKCKGQLYNILKSDFWIFQSFLQNGERNEDMPIPLEIITNKQEKQNKTQR